MSMTSLICVSIRPFKNQNWLIWQMTRYNELYASFKSKDRWLIFPQREKRKMQRENAARERKCSICSVCSSITLLEKLTRVIRFECISSAARNSKCSVQRLHLKPFSNAASSYFVECLKTLHWRSPSEIHQRVVSSDPTLTLFLSIACTVCCLFLYNGCNRFQMKITVYCLLLRIGWLGSPRSKPKCSHFEFDCFSEHGLFDIQSLQDLNHVHRKIP